MASGIPGNPPPVPTSTTLAPSGTASFRRLSESAKCLTAIPAGSVTEVRFMRALVCRTITANLSRSGRSSAGTDSSIASRALLSSCPNAAAKS
jgi:hypothetical protein